MDITPARLSNESETKIDITDKEGMNYSFSLSNPKGYCEWFLSRCQLVDADRYGYHQQKTVEPVREYKDKLPLQRVVQILKRHMDVMFQDDPDHKPVSIIITTLAAKAYNGTKSLFQALSEALRHMHEYIEVLDDGRYVVANPSIAGENFADKWNTDASLAHAFYSWQNKAIADLVDAPISSTDYSALEESLGAGVVGRAITDIEPINTTSMLSTDEYEKLSVKAALSVQHRQKLGFAYPRHPRAAIFVKVSDKVSSYSYPNNGSPIPKGKTIDFT
jgi:hypothetical protein